MAESGVSIPVSLKYVKSTAYKTALKKDFEELKTWGREVAKTMNDAFSFGDAKKTSDLFGSKQIRDARAELDLIKQKLAEINREYAGVAGTASAVGTDVYNELKLQQQYLEKILRTYDELVSKSGSGFITGSDISGARNLTAYEDALFSMDRALDSLNAELAKTQTAFELALGTGQEEEAKKLFGMISDLTARIKEIKAERVNLIDTQSPEAVARTTREFDKRAEAQRQFQESLRRGVSDAQREGAIRTQMLLAFERLQTSIKSSQQRTADALEREKQRRAEVIRQYVQQGKEARQRAEEANRVAEAEKRVAEELKKQKSQSIGSAGSVGGGFREAFSQLKDSIFNDGKGIQEALDSVDFSQVISKTNLWGTAISAVVEVVKLLIKWFKHAMGVALQLIKKFVEVSASAIKAVASFKLFGDSAKDALVNSNKLFKTLIKYGFGVRSFYFLFRKIRTAIVEAVKEISEYDSQYTQSLLNMRQQLMDLKYNTASAVIQLVTAIEAPLTRLIELLSTIMLWLNRIFAFFTHQNSITTATTQVDKLGKSTGSAAKNAKKLLTYLSGLDQIRQYTDPNKDSSGSGSSGGSDKGYSVSFSTEDINFPFNTMGEAFNALLQYLNGDGLSSLESVLGTITDKINGFTAGLIEMLSFGDNQELVRTLGSAYGELLTNAMNNINWDDVGTSIGLLISTVIGFMANFISNFSWTDLGANIATAFNNALQQINPEELATVLWARFKIVFETLMGFIANIDPSTFGTSIAKFISGLAEQIGVTATNIDWSTAGTNIGLSVTNAVRNINWASVGSNLSKFINGLAEFLANAVNNVDWTDFVHRLVSGIESFLAGLREGGFWGNINSVITTLSGAFSELVDALASSPEVQYALRTALHTIMGLAGEIMSAEFGVFGSLIGMLFSGSGLEQPLYAETIQTNEIADRLSGSVDRVGDSAGHTANQLKVLTGNTSDLGTRFDKTTRSVTKGEADMRHGAKVFADSSVDDIRRVNVAHGTLEKSVSDTASKVSGKYATMASDVSAKTSEMATNVSTKLDTVTTAIDGKTTTIASKLSQGFKDGVQQAKDALADDKLGSPIRGKLDPVTGLKIDGANSPLEKVKNALGNSFKTGVDNADAHVGSLGGKISNAYTKAGGIKSAVNSIIGGSEALGNGFVDGFNKVIESFEKINVSVPAIGGKVAQSYRITTGGRASKLTIPRLAQGAVLPANAPFLAVLGDQKKGKNLEAPEGLIRQIISEELAKSNASGGTYVFTANLDGREIFSEVVSQAQLYRMRTGNPAFT